VLVLVNSAEEDILAREGGGNRRVENRTTATRVMCIPNIIRMIKLRRMGWAGHVARAEEKRIEYKVLAVQPEGKGITPIT